MKSKNTQEVRARDIDARLKKLYPHPRTALHFSTPLELLVATILSAQCTDERVNRVTKNLFKKYKSPGDYVRAAREEIEKDIRPTGFFHSKARSIQACCAALLEKFNGRIPETLEQMLDLPGVGRKTANLVLGEAFGVPGIVVDTHVRRVAERLGLTKNTDPDRIEQDLMPLLPPDRWTPFSHELIFHGRNTCKARSPDCPHCVLENLCPWPDKIA
jgi:endonuclease-3